MIRRFNRQMRGLGNDTKRIRQLAKEKPPDTHKGIHFGAALKIFSLWIKTLSPSKRSGGLPADIGSADVVTGQTYTITVSSRFFRFTPRTVQVDGDLTLPTLSDSNDFKFKSRNSSAAIRRGSGVGHLVASAHNQLARSYVDLGRLLMVIDSIHVQKKIL